MRRSWNDRRPTCWGRRNDAWKIHSWAYRYTFSSRIIAASSVADQKWDTPNENISPVNPIAYARIPVVHVHKITLYASRAARDYVARHSRELRRPWNSKSEFAASSSGVATRGTTTLLSSAKSNTTDSKHDEIIPRNPSKVLETGITLVAYAEIPRASPSSWKLFGVEQTCNVIYIMHDRNLFAILQSRIFLDSFAMEDLYAIIFCESVSLKEREYNEQE